MGVEEEKSPLHEEGGGKPSLIKYIEYALAVICSSSVDWLIINIQQGQINRNQRKPFFCQIINFIFISSKYLNM